MDEFPALLPHDRFAGEKAPIRQDTIHCRAAVKQFNDTAGWGIIDLAESYTMSGASGVARGIALVRGASETQDGALILDEFDATEAKNVTWLLHTQANVTITSATTATLTASTKTGVVMAELKADVGRCPQAKLRLSPGATEWVPSARVWKGFTAILLEAASVSGCKGLQVSVVPQNVAHP